MPSPTDIRPPFTRETATQKVRAAEDAWNTRDPKRVSLAYSVDSQWRNRDTFVAGREQIVEFLTGKWDKELDYRLVKQMWAFTDNRIAVRFQYEYRNQAGNWFRAYGNENWEFDETGLMRRREATTDLYSQTKLETPQASKTQVLYRTVMWSTAWKFSIAKQAQKTLPHFCCFTASRLHRTCFAT